MKALTLLFFFLFALNLALGVFNVSKGDGYGGIAFLNGLGSGACLILALSFWKEQV